MKIISEWDSALQRQVDREATPAEVLEFEAAASAKPAPPATVSMRQARLALLAAGRLADVDAAIEAIDDEALRERAMVEWSSAKDVERNHPFTKFFSTALELSDADLDALFLSAATY